MNVPVNVAGNLAGNLSGGVVTGPDGRPRCAWGVSTPDYRGYHDTEWGVRCMA